MSLIGSRMLALGGDIRREAERRGDGLLGTYRSMTRRGDGDRRRSISGPR